LRDPYGRFYRYILRAEDGKFAIFGRSGTGEIDLDLSHEGTLAPVSEERPSRAPFPSVDRQPRVRVVQ
jgi:hypothetical protein